MRITDVEPGFIFEGENPQYAQLTQLLQTAREPWERNQIKWRIENLRSSEALAGEPGGGNGAPLDAQGNYIPVLPTKEWMARNPSIVKTLPNDALPPGMQQPGVVDKIKGALGLEETEELNEGGATPIASHPEYKEAESSFGMAQGMMKAVKMTVPSLGPWGGKLTAVNAAGNTVGVWDNGMWNGKNSQLMYNAQQEADAAQAKHDASPEAQAERDARNAPFVPKDYQTGEPLTKSSDGKWYNKAGQERDNLHGGPIMAGGTAQFRSLKENSELTRIKDITSRVLKG